MRKKQLRVFKMNDTHIAPMRQDVISLLTAHSVYRVISLEGSQFANMVYFGSRHLHHKVGKSKFSLHPQVPTVRFLGTALDWENIQSILKTLDDAEASNSPEPAADNEEPSSHEEAFQECPSCTCEVEDPITLACGHSYCKWCFDGVCHEQLDGLDPAIICFAATEGASCKYLVEMEELCEIVSNH
jgi:hypothetical protein